MAQPYSLPMDILTEQRLVRRIVQGDAEGFEAIVAAHSQRVVGLAWRLVGHRDDAEDLAQEAFLRLYRALPGLRGECALATWLHQTVSRLAIDYLRREQLRRKIFWFRKDEQDDRAERVADPDATPSDQLLAGERRQRLRRALQKLSPRQRAVFVLRHEEGLPLKEIAVLLGLEEGTVKVHLHRAVKALAKELADLAEKKYGTEMHG